MIDNNKEQYQKFCELGLPLGRLIAGSKSGYRRQFPDHQVIFNANIIVEGECKIWWGDLDITRDKEELKQLASFLGKDLYILSEHDARFGNEGKSFEFYKSKAIVIINKDAN